MIEIKYSAYFDGKGYYADYQPHYKWSFTDDINEAKKYKTIKGVLERLDYSESTINYKGIKNSVVIEQFETIKTNDSTTVIKTILGTLDINDEVDKMRKKKIEKFIKKYPLVNEPLKVDIEEISADDPYWS
jgi:hypothetical protein